MPTQEISTHLRKKKIELSAGYVLSAPQVHPPPFSTKQDGEEGKIDLETWPLSRH